MNHVKNTATRNFRYVLLGTNQINSTIQKQLQQLGGFSAIPDQISPITGTFLGSIDRILESEKSPLLVFYDPPESPLIPALERNFSLDPRILWIPLHATQETTRNAVFQLRKQWILGTELTNSATQFEHLFQSGPHFRFLLDPQGNITKACQSALSLLGDRAQPGQAIQDLDDYPPGVLGEFLDRARVISQIQGEFLLHLPPNPEEETSGGSFVTTDQGTRQPKSPHYPQDKSQNPFRSIRMRSQVEFISETGPFDPQGYFLVTWYDISHQASELKRLKQRIEQEGMLSMVASRFIPFTNDFEPLIQRTLEDISTTLGFGKARLLPVTTNAGEILLAHCPCIEKAQHLPDDLEPLTRYFIQKGRTIDPIIKPTKSAKIDSQAFALQEVRYLYGIWVPRGLATILEITVSRPQVSQSPRTEKSTIQGLDDSETPLIIRMATEMLGLFFARLSPELGSLTTE